MADSSSPSINSSRRMKFLKAAFRAMEPPNCFVSLAKQIGGGSITEEVQTYILEHCINNVVEGNAYNSMYVRNILKKIILAAESTSEVTMDGLYEQLTLHMTLQRDEDSLKEKSRIFKEISFLFPGYDDCSDSLDLVFPLQCSLNMLEGDTGCALWPSSLFLSEIIVTYQDTFSNKVCFEVGSGAGLIGISLIRVGASEVVLTDGDESTLANMKYNLELNKLPLETKVLQKTNVVCKHLKWESPSKRELQHYRPDIVLGADIIYDPICVPHLIQVLSILLSGNANDCESTHHDEDQRNNTSDGDVMKVEPPIAYIAQVIRNHETFNYFLKLAEESYLCVVDITEEKQPYNLLPYMLSYDRSSVRLFKVSSLRNCNILSSSAVSIRELRGLP
ncbi:uncharacterized protein A4U43_C02F16620 [Asparagus officinalis]|uniref:FAM86 N-terminal domain-containing protein n=1 Tax=Asparagus officinalis TaxID=4686 RepID=A0A5P1FNS8_ASPOF|nr:protein-lysine N-methyltransferase EEF2KMT isoform X2 [Asparagus officinalis]ONK78280.1 uncharacterized protein A4U43_C02F16620 [Asparagus officinalis]